MQYSPRFVLALTTVSLAAACADDPEPISADDFAAPETLEDIDAIYDQLGTCNDSFLTRTLTPRAELSTSTLWTTPAAAPAGLTGSRSKTGWNRVLLATELTFDGIGGSITNPGPACDAVQRLLSPISDGRGREQFTHALLYLEEAAHPYASFPDGGVQAMRVDAPLALTSYLAVVFAKRDVASGGSVTFSDVTEQHLPMYVACAKPFAIETTTAMFDDLAALDPGLCDAGTDLDDDGDLDHRCVAERGIHIADNSCTFVVDASALELADGQRHPAIFGGTITTRGFGEALTYELTVDRFSR